MKYFIIATVSFVIASCSHKLNNSNGNGFIYDAQANKYDYKGYILIWENGAESFSDSTKKRLVETFYKVYPLLATEFNKNTSKQIVFKIDPAYKGVAATSGDVVRYDPTWFEKNPEDIDVVTHEVMHIVQAYGSSVGPWWLTEGIADYVREVYGVNNAAAHWSLHLPTEKENYDNGYRVTARFLLWIEKKVKPGFVKYINNALREHSYKDDMWQQYTGKTVETLWARYKENPSI